MLIVALLLLAIVAMPVSAQGITYNTGFQVQNLGSGDASITITYYNQDGTTAATTMDTIPAGGSKNYFPLTAVPDGFNGSVVVSSNQPVAAIANELGNGSAYAASYAGFDAGSTTMNLPLVMRNNGGFNTWFNVQNAGTATANVTVTYKPASSGNAATQSANIEPGAAHTFDQATFGDLGNKFVGSAVVTSNQPIVATVNQVGATTLMSYDGFASGSTGISFPLVNVNNGGYITGIQIMNLGGSATDVTVHYEPMPGQGSAADETKSIPAGASATFALSQFGSAKFVGSGRVSANSGNQPLVAVVNQLNLGANKGASYGGFDPAGATSAVSFPLVMAKNGGYFTGTVVQNVGASATTVTISYSGAGTDSKTINPGESAIFDQNATFGSKFVGSASVTASGGGKIIGMCNELNSGAPGDAFLVYEGFSY